MDFFWNDKAIAYLFYNLDSLPPMHTHLFQAQSALQHILNTIK